MQTQHSDQNMCMHANCTELDLLPANCTNCHKQYCSKHLNFSDHSCTKRMDAVVPVCPLCEQPVPPKAGESADRAVSRHIDAGCVLTGGKSVTRHNFCAFGNCTRNEITPMICDRCKNSFCLNHRLPVQHRCTVPSPPPQQRGVSRLIGEKGGHGLSPQAASLKLAQNQRQSQQTKVTSASRPALKLHQMEMQNTKKEPVGKNKVSDLSTATTVRIFFPEDLVLKPMYFIFTKTSSVGRVLDSVCNYADILNDNHHKEAEADRWHLFLLKNSMCLPSSVSMVEMGLEENDAVMLHKGATLPDHLVQQIDQLRTEAQKSKRDCISM